MKPQIPNGCSLIHLKYTMAAMLCEVSKRCGEASVPEPGVETCESFLTVLVVDITRAYLCQLLAQVLGDL